MSLSPAAHIDPIGALVFVLAGFGWGKPVPVNVYEASDALVVVAPLPAVQPEDVAIDLWPGRMRITASLRSAAPREYLMHEWSYGGYEREIDLPDGWGGGAEASLANGQLAVRVLPRQADEFTCSQCFLVHHRSQLAREKNGQFVCRDCAA